MSDNDYDKIEIKINPVKVIAFIFIVLMILAGIYGFFGLNSVGTNKVGLKKNLLTNKVGDKIYDTGMYFTDPFHGFITFPTVVQEIEFVQSNEEDAISPLDSRTKDGLLILVQVVFYYQLQVDKVDQLFRRYGKHYEDIFIGQARTTLRDVISYYSAIEFFMNRTIIGLEMEENLNLALSEMFSGISYFQMREIDLPLEFEMALERVQIAKQEYEIAKYEQEAALIRAETEIFMAQAQANITILDAEASAEAYSLQMEAEAKAINVTLSAQRLQYYAMGQELNLTSSELLALLWVLAIAEHDESLIIIGADTPIIIQEEFTNSTK